MEGVILATNRVVICSICKKEIEVRSAFAHETLNNHINKEHNITNKKEKNELV